MSYCAKFEQSIVCFGAEIVDTFSRSISKNIPTTTPASEQKNRVPVLITMTLLFKSLFNVSKGKFIMRDFVDHLWF